MGERVSASVATNNYVLTTFRRRTVVPQALQRGRVTVSINMCIERMRANEAGQSEFKG